MSDPEKEVDPELSEYMASIGRKGGRKTGDSKRRSADHYRDMQKKAVKKFEPDHFRVMQARSVEARSRNKAVREAEDAEQAERAARLKPPPEPAVPVEDPPEPAEEPEERAPGPREPSGDEIAAIERLQGLADTDTFRLGACALCPDTGNMLVGQAMKDFTSVAQEFYAGEELLLCDECAAATRLRGDVYPAL